MYALNVQIASLYKYAQRRSLLCTGHPCWKRLQLPFKEHCHRLSFLYPNGWEAKQFLDDLFQLHAKHTKTCLSLADPPQDSSEGTIDRDNPGS